VSDPVAGVVGPRWVTRGATGSIERLGAAWHGEQQCCGTVNRARRIGLASAGRTCRGVDRAEDRLAACTGNKGKEKEIKSNWAKRGLDRGAGPPGLRRKKKKR
jgi:hypothetical protein